ncbi:response regulator [uncultured Methanospirillum sp.]|uniref:ATP-binding response regulator n=1 Tax=uncultured Methanospirillum sp. TaxID=262503 RepID=UPI0029C68E87|nr:response regulator [uncultured Methanospirillum sp.]
MSDPVKVLVVEDEFVTGLEIRARLEDLGYEVLGVVDTGEEAITKAEDLLPDIMIMDITLRGEMTGIESADIIRKKLTIPVIFLTAHSDDSTVEKAIQSEPFGYLIKPLDERILKTTIQMALYKYAMDKALIKSEKRYRSIAEQVDNAIIILNQDYSVAFLNTHAKKIFQMPDSSEVQHLDEVIPEELSIRVKDDLSKVFEENHSLKITHHFFHENAEFWFDCSLIPISIDIGVFQVILLLHDVTDMIKIEKEIEKKGIVQIEHNMEQFQILNDRIRNPLAIIVAAASLSDSIQNDEIIKQVMVIDELVCQLDRGWVQSEMVRRFLLKHYGHGKEIN